MISTKISTTTFNITIRELCRIDVYSFYPKGWLYVAVSQNSNPKMSYGEFIVSLKNPSTLFTSVEFRNEFGLTPRFCKNRLMEINDIEYSEIKERISLAECFEIQHAVEEAIKWLEFWE